MPFLNKRSIIKQQPISLPSCHSHLHLAKNFHQQMKRGVAFIPITTKLIFLVSVSPASPLSLSLYLSISLSFSIFLLVNYHFLCPSHYPSYFPFSFLPSFAFFMISLILPLSIVPSLSLSSSDLHSHTFFSLSSFSLYLSSLSHPASVLPYSLSHKINIL